MNGRRGAHSKSQKAWAYPQAFFICSYLGKKLDTNYNLRNKLTILGTWFCGGGSGLHLTGRFLAFTATAFVLMAMTFTRLTIKMTAAGIKTASMSKCK